MKYLFEYKNINTLDTLQLKYPKYVYLPLYKIPPPFQFQVSIIYKECSTLG